MLFYCQECGHGITVEMIGQLDEGRCPQCGTQTGFSTTKPGEDDGFDKVVVLNDTEAFKEIDKH